MQDVPSFNLSGNPSRKSLQSRVVWGDRVVTVGGGAPVRIQSMTNTDTVDVIGTAIQVKELANAGSEMVRITVNTVEAAQAVPFIREQLDRMDVSVPLIAGFYLLPVHVDPSRFFLLSVEQVNQGMDIYSFLNLQ